MNIKNFQNKFKKFNGRVYFDYSIKKLNWFNIGGNTSIFFKPETLQDLIGFLKMKNNYNSNPKYSLLAKWLHWSFVVLFAYGIYKQVEDLSDLEDLSLLKFEIFFAFIFLLFLAFRFVYMTKTQIH